jgi:hypothetical protein
MKPPRDLPACNVVPQQTEPPRAPVFVILSVICFTDILNNFNELLELLLLLFPNFARLNKLYYEIITLKKETGTYF